MARVILELCGIRRTPSLPSLSGPLWSGIMETDWVLSIGQVELNCVLMLKWIVWKKLFLYLIVCKQKKIVLKVTFIVWNRPIHLYGNGFGFR